MDNSSIKFCEYLFLNRDFTDDEKKCFSFILKNILGKKTAIPYDLMTQKVLNIEDENLLNQLLNNVSKHLNDVEMNLEDLLDLQLGDGISYQILSHINMCVGIRKSINKSVEYYDKELGKAREEITSLKDIKQKIYTDFITIIGIFTSIIFALFGGVQMLSNILGKNIISNYHQILNVMFIGLFYLLSMFFLLIVLFSGINDLIQNNKFNISKKFFIILILMFLTIFAIGFFKY